jgi:hypothetical protein
MAKTYYGQDSGGVHAPQTTPPASGPVRALIYEGPTFGNRYDYSAAVNGSTTFYVVDNGPSLGRQRSAA